MYCTVYNAEEIAFDYRSSDGTGVGRATIKEGDMVEFPDATWFTFQCMPYLQESSQLDKLLSLAGKKRCVHLKNLRLTNVEVICTVKVPANFITVTLSDKDGSLKL